MPVSFRPPKSKKISEQLLNKKAQSDEKQKRSKGKESSFERDIRTLIKR